MVHSKEFEELINQSTEGEVDEIHSQIISGMGISKETEEKDEEKDLTEYLDEISNFTSNNDEGDEETESKFEKENEYLRKKQKELVYQKNYEKEQLEKEKRLAEEKIKLEEEQALEKEKKDKQLLSKIKVRFTQKNKKTKKSSQKIKKTKNLEKTKNIEKPKAKENKNLEKNRKITKTDLIEKENTENRDWKYIATHDELTGLFNIYALENRLKNSKAKYSTFIYLDINNLKYYNDNYGHALGNDLILGISETLSELFPQNAYRIGGDEFVIFLKKKTDVHFINEKIKEFHHKLEILTQQNKNKLIYSASVGYYVGDGTLSNKEIMKKADELMYKNKKAYKVNHPLLDMRNPKKEIVKKDHDELLSRQQYLLKKSIVSLHTQPMPEQISSLITELQKQASETLAIIVASADFSTLMILRDVNIFIDAILSDLNLDYSYLYLIKDAGTQYYGTDEYLDEVTHLFESLAKKIRYDEVSEKEILKVKGINIFKEIYIDEDI